MTTDEKVNSLLNSLEELTKPNEISPSGCGEILDIVEELRQINLQALSEEQVNRLTQYLYEEINNQPELTLSMDMASKPQLVSALTTSLDRVGLSTNGTNQTTAQCPYSHELNYCTKCGWSRPKPDAYEPKRPHQWDRVGICVNCGNGVKARDVLDGTNLECSGVLVQLRLEGMILNTLMAIPVGNGQSQRISMSKKIAQNLMVGGVTFV